MSGNLVSLSQKSQVGTATLANLLGLSKRRVEQLTKEGVLQRASRGRYDLFDAAQAFLKHAQKRADASPASIEAARLKRAQADAKERDNAAAAGELLERAEVEQAIAQIVRVLVQTMDGLPSRLATDAAEREAIRRETRAARDEAVRELESILPDPGGDRSAAAGAEQVA